MLEQGRERAAGDLGADGRAGRAGPERPAGRGRFLPVRVRAAAAVLPRPARRPRTGRARRPTRTTRTSLGCWRSCRSDWMRFRPVHEKPVLKGVRPGIAADDRVVIWGGGIYNWFDPETLIRAVAALAKRQPRDQTVLSGDQASGRRRDGDRHRPRGNWQPNSARRTRPYSSTTPGSTSPIARTTCSRRLRASSTHHLHVETEFSFRTRILDYLWAGLPMVVTEGDSMAELVEREGLGIVVPAEDVGCAGEGARAGAVRREVRDDRAKECQARRRRIHLGSGACAARGLRARPAPRRRSTGRSRHRPGARTRGGAVDRGRRTGCDTTFR